MILKCKLEISLTLEQILPPPPLNPVYVASGIWFEFLKQCYINIHKKVLIIYLPDNWGDSVWGCLGRHVDFPPSTSLAAANNRLIPPAALYIELVCIDVWYLAWICKLTKKLTICMYINQTQRPLDSFLLPLSSSIN